MTGWNVFTGMYTPWEKSTEEIPMTMHTSTLINRKSLGNVKNGIRKEDKGSESTLGLSTFLNFKGYASNKEHVDEVRNTLDKCFY